MKVTNIELSKTEVFNNTFLDYISKENSLEKFYEDFPDMNGFKSKIDKYSFPVANRLILHNSIKSQYQNLELLPLIESNLSLLTEEKTFTVTTGHQLNIFSGPLYFVYKIITVINLAKKLKENFSNFNFVPIYWMASEDHDFEEINHFNLFGKKHIWETKQKGAVGRFTSTEISEIFNQIQEELPLFRKAYTEYNSLADATRFFVNELFGKYGLLIVDGDNKDLKSLFKPIIKDEILNKTSFKIVTQTTKDLDSLGYKTQINSREINLFFLDNDIRERIIEENGKFKINNTTLEFSKQEILDLIETNPEKFSPNVVLRPLYEETILPNICYTGGPAEINYWLQLKSLFFHYAVPFPILMPRNFALYINKPLEKKMKKYSISEVELFLKEEALISQYLLRFSDQLFILEDEKSNSEKTFKTIADKAQIIDPTLVGYVLSENKKVAKIIEEIEKRLKKAEQKKSADDIAQVSGIKNKLFPNGTLQERNDNFLNFYINDPNFIDNLVKILNPLSFTFNIFTEG